MNRRQFIESQGATCANWAWSWSFVNHDRRQVIFGAWTHYTNEDLRLILDDAWEVRRGRRQPGYVQAREHIRLCEEGGYELYTFPITKSAVDNEGGPASIAEFEPKLSLAKLVRAGTAWYAATTDARVQVTEEFPEGREELVEGAAVRVTVNAYERSGKAREACLRHHGYACSVCGFNFERAYGALGKEYIHVHHVVPLSEIRRSYKVNPIRDLVPVCPNCHALIHRTNPAQTIAAMKRVLRGQESFEWPLLL